jgi:hypothetical protein
METSETDIKRRAAPHAAQVFLPRSGCGIVIVSERSFSDNRHPFSVIRHKGVVIYCELAEGEETDARAPISV